MTPSKPLAAAASQAQYALSFRSTRRSLKRRTPNPKFEVEVLLLTPTPATLLTLAAAARLKCVPQIARVGGIHAKDCVLHIFDRAHVHFVAEHVAELNQSGQFVEKFGLFDFSNSLDQQLAVSRRSGKAHRLQERDFASA